MLQLWDNFYKMKQIIISILPAEGRRKNLGVRRKILERKKYHGRRPEKKFRELEKKYSRDVFLQLPKFFLRSLTVLHSQPSAVIFFFSKIFLRTPKFFLRSSAGEIFLRVKFHLSLLDFSPLPITRLKNTQIFPRCNFIWKVLARNWKKKNFPEIFKFLKCHYFINICWFFMGLGYVLTLGKVSSRAKQLLPQTFSRREKTVEKLKKCKKNLFVTFVFWTKNDNKTQKIIK